MHNGKHHLYDDLDKEGKGGLSIINDEEFN